MLPSVQRFIRLVTLLLMLVLLAACAPPLTLTQMTATARIPDIAVIDPPKTMTNFTLTNQEGQPVHLSDFKGKYVLMAFGYTHCPDVCPITLARFKQIKARLGPLADQLEFVWISVDGARDTPEYIKQYLNNFDPEFNGLTSDSETVRSVITEYGGVFELNNAGGLRKENYTVDHTASHFLVDPEGRWVRTYGYSLEIAGIADDLKKLLIAI